MKIVTLVFLLSSALMHSVHAGVDMTLESADSPVYDVVVVGGGLSGLWSARQLQKEITNASVLVLEARERVGGRTFTKKFGSDDFDLGGQWVGTPQRHIMEVIKELGLETYSQYITGTKILDLNGKVKHYKSVIPSLSLFKMIDLGAFMLKAEHLRKQVPRYCPYEMKNALAYDSTTVASYVSKFPWLKDVKDMLDITSRVVFGKDASELSILYFLHYVQCGAGIMPLLDSTKGGAQEFKVVGGTQQISQRLAEGLNVQFEEPVFAVSQSDDLVTVTTNKGRYQAKHVVMATPPHMTNKISFDPPFNPVKDHLYSRMTMGHLMKIIVTYPTAFWKEKGFSGEIVSNAEPIDVCYDDTPKDGTPALLCFVGGSYSSKWTSRSQNDRRDRVIQLFAQYFGDEAHNYASYIEQDWGTEPYTGGCPVGSMNAGTITQYGHELRKAHGRVVFAGTEMATLWYGYMSGAIQAGQRAAIEVMEALKLPVPEKMYEFLHLGEGSDDGSECSSDPNQLPLLSSF